MLIRQFLHKLGIGIAALTMGATFMNCAFETSGFGEIVELRENFWCTEYTGAEVTGFRTGDQQLFLAEDEDDYLFQIDDGLGCHCFDQGIANSLIPHLPDDYNSGDPITLLTKWDAPLLDEDSPLFDEDSLAHWMRDTIHETARYDCEERGRDLAAARLNADVDIEESYDAEDILELHSNCYGSDRDDNGDFEDIVKSRTTPFRSIYNAHCDGEVYGPIFAGGITPSKTSTPSNRTHATIVLDRNYVLELATNLTGFGKEEGIQLVLSADGDGFRIYDPNRSAVLKTANLADGDKLESVNNMAVKTARQGYEAYEKFKAADTIRLVLTTRHGQKITNRYTFK